MKIQFLGAAHEVTGSCTLLTVGDTRILIDCGMEQGADIYENCELPITAGDIDCVLLTHAHIDHSGKLPRLVREGYSGPIYCTEAARKLCRIMLLDSAHIQEFEAEWRNRKAKRSGREEYQPLYTTADAEATLELMHGCSYGKQVALADGITATFSDAGHLLGSASILIDADGQRILFSGDLGNTSRPLIRDPQPAPEADYVICESTYGDRDHGERPDYVTQLAEIFNHTFARGGNVVIPSFAVGRTQELLYLIRQIKERHLVKTLPDFPVWVDSPMAVEATGIYADGNLREFFDDETVALLDAGVNPIRFNGLRVSVTSDDSKLINADDSPKVILSASGMCEAGRIRHHLKHNLWRPESTILFVGYQSDGTIGRKLVDGESEVKLFGEEISVRAHIAQLAGISGHADRSMLLNWLSGTGKPRRVFINHGEDGVCDQFAAAVSERLGTAATAPYNGAAYDLATDCCLDSGNRERIKRAAPSGGSVRQNAVYDRLLAAAKRLVRLIEGSRGRANKDMARLADQIDNLCDKWQ